MSSAKRRQSNTRTSSSDSKDLPHNRPDSSPSSSPTTEQNSSSLFPRTRVSRTTTALQNAVEQSAELNKRRKSPRLSSSRSNTSLTETSSLIPASSKRSRRRFSILNKKPIARHPSKSSMESSSSAQDDAHIEKNQLQALQDFDMNDHDMTENENKETNEAQGLPNSSEDHATDEQVNDEEDSTMDETSTDEHHLIQNMSELTQLLGPEMSGTLSALLQRMASGSSTNPAAPAIQQNSKFGPIIRGLKSMDPSDQFMAVQELNNILAISTEEDIGYASGSGFQVDVIVPELVKILQGEDNPFAMDNPDLQLLACRALSNLLEALPTASTLHTIVSNGAIRVLCSKLLAIDFIDVAEHSIYTLERLSRDHPRAVMKEGVPAACLNFLDFFDIRTQRIAVQCVANSFQRISREVLEEAKPAAFLLLPVMRHHDPKIAETACYALANYVESVSRHAHNRGTPPTSESPLVSLPAFTSLEMVQSVCGVLDNLLDSSDGRATDAGISSFFRLLRTLKYLAEESDDYRLEIIKQEASVKIVALLSLEEVIGGQSRYHVLKNIIWHSLESLFGILDFAEALITATEFDKIIDDGSTMFQKWKRFGFGSKRETTISFTSPFDCNFSSEILLKAELKPALAKFSKYVIPSALTVLQTNVDLLVQIKCTILLLRIVSAMPSDSLKAVLLDIPLGRNIFSAISRTLVLLKDLMPNAKLRIPVDGSLDRIFALISYLIITCITLMEKLPDCYTLNFEREGVFSVLDSLVGLIKCDDIYTENLVALLSEMEKKRSLPKPNSSSIIGDSSKLESSQGARIYQRDTHGAITKQNISRVMSERQDKRETGLVTILSDPVTTENTAETLEPRQWENFTVYEMQEHYESLLYSWYRCQLYVKVNGLLGLRNEKDIKTSSDIADRLKKIVKEFDGNASFEVAREIFQWFSDDSVTAFELGKSNFLPLFTEICNKMYLKGEDVFVNYMSKLFPSGDQLTSFAQKLQGLISVSYPIESPLAGRLNSVRIAASNGSSLLSRQIRLRLIPSDDFVSQLSKSNINFKHPESDLKRILSTVVSIQSYAEFNSVESFFLPRLLSSLNITEEKTVETQLTDSGRIRHDSNVVHNIEDESSHSSPVTHKNSNTNTTGLAIRFIIDDMLIDSSLSVYGAVHRYEAEQLSRQKQGLRTTRKEVIENCKTSEIVLKSDINIFENIYTIKFRLSDRGSFCEDKVFSVMNEYTKHIPRYQQFGYDDECQQQDLEIKALTKLPHSLNFSHENDIAFSFSLLRFLHFVDTHQNSKMSKAPTFINKQIDSMVSKQLSETLLCASKLLPKWCYEICRFFKFLLPKETRLKFMEYSALNAQRVIVRNQQMLESLNLSDANDQQRNSALYNMLGIDGNVQVRISRQKVRIARDRLFESAVKVMGLYGPNVQYLLEIEFFDEVGSGLGPTLEFYSQVSLEWHRKDLNMWRIERTDGSYIHPTNGLFPLSWLAVPEIQRSQVLRQFEALGIFVAKSIADFRLIDIRFHPVFLRKTFFEPLEVIKAATSADFCSIDKVLGSSILNLVNLPDLENLALDFTLPGFPEVELVNNGKNIAVTSKNVNDYLLKVMDAVCGSGIEPQLSAFRRGFKKVLPIAALGCLFVEEIQEMLSSPPWEGNWKRDELISSIKLDHGLNKDHAVVQYFFDMLCSFDLLKQRAFLQFVTGCPRLPHGGFKSLSPPLTIVRKSCEPNQKPDDYLPSVMTCVNYVKLPEYSSHQVLEDKFQFAMLEGQNSFHLS